MLSKQFITAGRAVFTVEIPPPDQEILHSPPHYTFRVKRKEANLDWPEAYFVQILTGPDNTSSYTYLGMLSPETGEVRLTKKSKYNDDSLPVKILRRVLVRLWADQGDLIRQAGWELHHEGKCCRCGRALTVPESVESGIGPECRQIMGI